MGLKTENCVLIEEKVDPYYTQLPKTSKTSDDLKEIAVNRIKARLNGRIFFTEFVIERMLL